MSSSIKHGSAAVKVNQFQEFSHSWRRALHLYTLNCRIPNDPLLISQANSNAENIKLISAMLCAALYPNVVQVKEFSFFFLLSSISTQPAFIWAQCGSLEPSLGCQIGSETGAELQFVLPETAAVPTG